jgi:nucleotide-binding universal stress UspA family protein
MYKRILCPVDGSDTSNLGMKEAIRIAKCQNGKLRFVHIIDTYFPIFDATGNSMLVDMTDALRKSAEQIIKKAKAAADRAGVEADTQVTETLDGRPADFIVKEADKWSADLIVMGTHGLRGFSRLVMGSNAENVVRTSTVPVLLINSTKKKG